MPQASNAPIPAAGACTLHRQGHEQLPLLQAESTRPSPSGAIHIPPITFSSMSRPAVVLPTPRGLTDSPSAVPATQKDVIPHVHSLPSHCCTEHVETAVCSRLVGTCANDTSHKSSTEDTRDFCSVVNSAGQCNPWCIYYYKVRSSSIPPNQIYLAPPNLPRLLTSGRSPQQTNSSRCLAHDSHDSRLIAWKHIHPRLHQFAQLLTRPISLLDLCLPTQLSGKGCPAVQSTIKTPHTEAQVPQECQLETKRPETWQLRTNHSYHNLGSKRYPRVNTSTLLSFSPRVLLVSLLLLTLPHLLLALPTVTTRAPSNNIVQENGSTLIIKSSLCRPVSEEDLRRIMGDYYDPTRMALNREDAEKRGFFPGLQGDDPYVDSHGMPSAEDLVMDEILDSSYEKEYWNDEDEKDEVDDEEGEEEILVSEREEVADIFKDDGEIEIEEIEENEELIGRQGSSWRSRYFKSDDSLQRRQHYEGDNPSDKLDSYEREIFESSRAYMKKRRRRRRSTSDLHPNRGNSPNLGGIVKSRLNDISSSSVNDTSDTSSFNENSDADTSVRHRRRSRRRGGCRRDDPNCEAGGKSGFPDSVLPLRIALANKDKKLRRKLKKKFRQRAKSFARKDPPWTCELNQVTLVLKGNTFPKILFDGKCKTTKCFYKLYDCKPKMYNIKLMQRDPKRCNPIPSLGNTTVFEEHWNLISKKITVGCDCVNANRKKSSNGGQGRSRSKSSHRRKNQ